MILITGATGHLGQLTIQSLLKKVPANEIIAAVRNLEKAQDLEKLGVQVREADYTRPELWAAALKNVDKVLLISSNEVGVRKAHHKTVIDAVKSSGSVKLLVYTSILHADRSPLILAEEHRETEQMIRDSGVPFVILRNGWYTENYAGSAKTALEHGMVYGAAKTGRIAGATRADFADAAAEVLTSKGELKKVYELAGDTSFSLADLAAEISKQTGKNIKYVDLTEADYKALLVKVGLPEPFAGILAQSDAMAAQNALLDESHDLSRLIGRKTTPLSAAVASSLR